MSEKPNEISGPNFVFGSDDFVSSDGDEVRFVHFVNVAYSEQKKVDDVLVLMNSSIPQDLRESLTSALSMADLDGDVETVSYHCCLFINGRSLCHHFDYEIECPYEDC